MPSHTEAPSESEGEEYVPVGVEEVGVVAEAVTVGAVEEGE